MNPIILNFILHGKHQEIYYCDVLITLGLIESLAIRPMDRKNYALGPVIDEDVFIEIYELAYQHEQLRGFYGKTSKINDFQV